jgi:hypothetical protein
VRVPQLWNLNAAVAKAGGRATAPLTGVLDDGFAGSHPDLAYETNVTPGYTNSHGTHVAGIIGATFDNGRGVDGVNPFARLVVRGSRQFPMGSTVVERRGSALEQVLWDFDLLVAGRPAVRVVNMSLGYRFGAFGIPLSDPAVRRLATEQGKLFVDILRRLGRVNGVLPIVVASAGNDSDTPLGPQLATYNSPMAAAGLALQAAPVIVVGGSQLDASALGGARRMGMSNTAPHVYAPGGGVFSTVAREDDPTAEVYDEMWGTSQAAPYVTAILGYLYTLRPSLPAPTMTRNPIRDLLVATGTTIAGANRPHVDAFAAALALDGAGVPGGGTPEVLRRLVDVDDGTLDGNTRVDAQGAEHTADARGDGAVDMRDFRRWRDWLLAAEGAPGLALDGGAAHPKKDLNGDGTVGGVNDATYARGDFNGDGIISRYAKRAVPGALEGAEKTDLEVLQHLFADSTGYTKAQLPALLSSGDLTVDAGRCFAAPGVIGVRVKVYPTGAPVPATGRTLRLGQPTHVATVPVDAGAAAGTPYTALVEALDAAGQVVGSARGDFSLRLGGDAHWAPSCAGYRIVIDGPAQRTVAPGDTVRVLVRWEGGARPPEYGVDTDYSLDYTGGEVIPFFMTDLWILPQAPGTYRLTVRDSRIANGADGTPGAYTIYVGVGGPPVVP